MTGIDLRNLRGYDVSADRAQRLREQCHRSLRQQNLRGPSPRDRKSSRWLGVLRLMAAGWCCAYLFETMREAAAIYWLSMPR